MARDKTIRFLVDYLLEKCECGGPKNFPHIFLHWVFFRRLEGLYSMHGNGD